MRVSSVGRKTFALFNKLQSRVTMSSPVRPSTRVPRFSRHPNAQDSAEHQQFLDECRKEAFRRARQVQAALPDGDFWERAKWLESKFNVVGGSLLGQRPSHVGNTRKRTSDGKAENTEQQRVLLKAWMASSEEESSDGGE